MSGVAGAETLWRAADLLDELAGGATPGPWGTQECVGADQAHRRTLGTYSLLHNGKREVALLRGFTEEREPDAAYIARMSPEVGKALAAHLVDPTPETLAAVARAILREP